MTASLTIGGAPVTIGGDTIDLTAAVAVSAQSAFVAMFQPPTVAVAAQSAFVAMLQSLVQVAAQSAAVAMFPAPAPPPPRRRQYVLM